MTGKRTNLGSGIAVALLLAAGLTAVATLERWTGLDSPIAAGTKAGITVRAPRVVVGRGETISQTAALHDQLLRAGQPPLGRAAAGLFCAFLVAGAVLAGAMRNRAARAPVSSAVAVFLFVL